MSLGAFFFNIPLPMGDTTAAGTFFLCVSTRTLSFPFYGTQQCCLSVVAAVEPIASKERPAGMRWSEPNKVQKKKRTSAHNERRTRTYFVPALSLHYTRMRTAKTFQVFGRSVGVLRATAAMAFITPRQVRHACFEQPTKLGNL